MKKYDLFIFAAEDSADVHGSNLLKELFSKNPDLKILAVAGPRMRKYKKIDVFMKMEDFHVMGFTDIIFSLYKLIKSFYHLRKKILLENPKACIFIDYPDFNLRLEKSLRKKGFKNKLIHYISPTVWAWRKKRADFMAKYLDILLTIFPFEKSFFSHTSLDVRYIGHPLAYLLKDANPKKNNEKIIGIFPGSRKNEIVRNLPIQLNICKKLLNEDKNLKFGISETNSKLIRSICKKQKINSQNFLFFPSIKNHEMMPKLEFAIATSGTINLELALNKVPTIVNFAIKPLDVFIGKYLLRINLPFFCIVNIIAQKEVFSELYGPSLKEEKLFELSKKLLFCEKTKQKSLNGCEEVIQKLKSHDANQKAAEIILLNL